MVAVVVSQDAESVDFTWVEGDPVSLAFYIEGVNWSGTYTAQIRAARTLASDVLAEFTVVAVTSTADTPAAEGDDTLFTYILSAEDSAALTGRTYYSDTQQTGGVTRLRHTIRVTPQVTE